MLKRFAAAFVFGAFASVAAGSELSTACGALPVAAAPRLNLTDEIAWLSAQRAIVDRDKVNEPVRAAMAARAVVLILEAARLEALGFQPDAKRIKDAIKAQLVDTGWRIGFMAKGGDLRAAMAHAWVGRAGLFAATGPNVPSPNEACALFNAPALAVFPEARFQRARCASERNPSAALGEMQAAAQAGHPAALDAIGQLCLKAQTPDLRCAVDAFCAAARAGRPDSAARAGWLLVNQDGAPDALGKARKLYDFAAASGDANGQNGLAELLETGRVGERNDTLAATWYARAAMQRLPVAQYNLARMYADGRGVPRDRKRALTLAQASATAGFIRGREFEQWLRANP